MVEMVAVVLAIVGVASVLAVLVAPIMVVSGMAFGFVADRTEDAVWWLIKRARGDRRS